VSRLGDWLEAAGIPLDDDAERTVARYEDRPMTVVIRRVAGVFARGVDAASEATGGTARCNCQDSSRESMTSSTGDGIDQRGDRRARSVDGYPPVFKIGKRM
jgi:hypothetical protein